MRAARSTGARAGRGRCWECCSRVAAFCAGSVRARGRRRGVVGSASASSAASWSSRWNTSARRGAPWSGRPSRATKNPAISASHAAVRGSCLEGCLRCRVVVGLVVPDEQAVVAEEQRVVVPARVRDRAEHVGQTAACRSRYSSSRCGCTRSSKHTRTGDAPALAALRSSSSSPFGSESFQGYRLRWPGASGKTLSHPWARDFRSSRSAIAPTASASL